MNIFRRRKNSVSTSSAPESPLSPSGGGGDPECGYAPFVVSTSISSQPIFFASRSGRSDASPTHFSPPPSSSVPVPATVLSVAMEKEKQPRQRRPRCHSESLDDDRVGEHLSNGSSRGTRVRQKSLHLPPTHEASSLSSSPSSRIRGVRHGRSVDYADVIRSYEGGGGESDINGKAEFSAKSAILIKLLKVSKSYRSY